MADLCVGLIIPFNAYREETGVMFESMLARKSFCKIITFIEVVLICASIYHLLALSMERLYVIKNAVNCRKVKLSTKTVCMTVLLCWLIALVPAAPLLTEWDTITQENTDCWHICSFPDCSGTMGLVCWNDCICDSISDHSVCIHHHPLYALKDNSRR